mgnify:FL=1
MDRLVLAINSDNGNSKISCRKFLNVFLLENKLRIADIKAFIEEDVLHVQIRGKAGKVKLGIYTTEEEGGL